MFEHPRLIPVYTLMLEHPCLIPVYTLMLEHLCLIPVNTLMLEHQCVILVYTLMLEHSCLIPITIVGAELAGRDTNKRFVKYNHFTKMKFGPVYIFGVTIGNSTTSAHWDIIKIRGSMGNIYAKETFFFCCMKYVDNPYYIKQSVTVVNIRHKMEKLTAPHFTCQNPRPGVVPNGVALTVNSYTCSEEHVVYRTPEVTLREPAVKLAICTKLAYGSRNAELLIDFMEVYKYLGVDKFVTYYLKDLNEDARMVLEYYHGW